MTVRLPAACASSAALCCPLLSCRPLLPAPASSLCDAARCAPLGPISWVAMPSPPMGHPLRKTEPQRWNLFRVPAVEDRQGRGVGIYRRRSRSTSLRSTRSCATRTPPCKLRLQLQCLGVQNPRQPWYVCVVCGSRYSSPVRSHRPFGQECRSGQLQPNSQPGIPEVIPLAPRLSSSHSRLARFRHRWEAPVPS